LKIHLNIILISPPKYSKFSLNLIFPYQTISYASTFPHMRHVGRPYNFLKYTQVFNIKEFWIMTTDFIYAFVCLCMNFGKWVISW
jgi:hypothetical protein